MLYISLTHPTGLLLGSAFVIPIRLTVSINVHGAFPKIDRWTGRTCIRERTLQDCALLRSAFGIALTARTSTMDALAKVAMTAWP